MGKTLAIIDGLHQKLDGIAVAHHRPEAREPPPKRRIAQGAGPTVPSQVDGSEGQEMEKAPHDDSDETGHADHPSPRCARSSA